MKKYFLLVILFLVATVSSFCQVEKLQNQCAFYLDQKYTDSVFFKNNNEILINELRKNQVNINVDYLEKIVSGEEKGNLMSRSMISTSSASFKIPVRATIYRRNDGSGGLTVSQITNYFNSVNQYFSNVGIQFILICEIDYINNTSVFDDGNTSSVFQNKKPNCINAYFTWGMSYANGFAESPVYTSNPGLAIRGRLSELNEVALVKVLAHELGHTLGLLHTFSRLGGIDENRNATPCEQESVSRDRVQEPGCPDVGAKKCEVNGDFIADTEADPGYIAGFADDCQWYAGGTDHWGETWRPQASNFMGTLSVVNCVNAFTPLQTGVMYLYAGYRGLDPTGGGIQGPDRICPGSYAYYDINYVPGLTYNWQCDGATVSVSHVANNRLTVLVETSRNFQQAHLYVTITGGCTGGDWPVVHRYINPTPDAACEPHRIASARQGDVLRMNDITLYPNPSSHTIRISLPDRGKYTLTFTRIDGVKIVESKEVSTSFFDLDVSDWPKGNTM